MSDHATDAVSPVLITVLTAILALVLLGASIPFPGGPLVVALLFLAARGWVRRRPGGTGAARVLLAAAVLALVIQAAIVASYAVTSGSDEGEPVSVPSARIG